MFSLYCIVAVYVYNTYFLVSSPCHYINASSLIEHALRDEARSWRLMVYYEMFICLPNLGGVATNQSLKIPMHGNVHHS